MSTEIPDEFRDVYDDETYKKSQEYTRVRTKFGFISSTFNLLVILAFWLFGGFNYLDLFLRPLIENEIYRGLVYIGILMLATNIINFPFSIYSTFVIEEKFGFNRTSIKTFIMDIVKSTALSIIIGAPLLALILYFFTEFGEKAWLYAWVFVVVVTLVLQYIAPKWIMPLFNKFTPLEDGELKQSIMDYAKSVNFSLKDVYVMDGSKRSSKSNAFFTGFGKNKKIALFDTLIKKHSISELLAVLAHEIGHYKKKHILQGMVLSFVHTGILFYLLSIFLSSKGLYDAFFMEHQPIYAGLLLFGMLYTSIDLIISIFMNSLSRKNEYQADEFSALTTGEPKSLISALKNLSKDNLSNLTPHKFYVFLNYSHPPLQERVEKLKKYVILTN